jgi:membrane protease subunit HflK
VFKRIAKHGQRGSRQAGIQSNPVKPAFNEVNEARQDRERTINEAQERANREIPKARGEATRTISEAEGYALERVNRAQGEATRFRAVLDEYKRA